MNAGGYRGYPLAGSVPNSAAFFRFRSGSKIQIVSLCFLQDLIADRERLVRFRTTNCRLTSARCRVKQLLRRQGRCRAREPSSWPGRSPSIDASRSRGAGPAAVQTMHSGSRIGGRVFQGVAGTGALAGKRAVTLGEFRQVERLRREAEPGAVSVFIPAERDET